MGEIVKKVQLSCLDKEGCPGKAHVYKALLDTGSSVTVISRKIAKEIKALIFKDYPITLGRKRYPAALVAIRLVGKGCNEISLTVAVADRIAKQAAPHAQIILGHDYLETEYAVLSYDDEPGYTVECLPKNKRKGRRK